MSTRVLEVKIIGGDHHRKTEFIPHIILTPTEDEANFSFQLYVALSRAKSSRNIRILLPEDQENTQTTNVVCPEVLAEVSAPPANAHPSPHPV